MAARFGTAALHIIAWELSRMLIHQLGKAATPPRVVVLGAHGFLAREVVSLLSEGGIQTSALGSQALNLTDSAAAERLEPLLAPDVSVVMISALTPDKGRDAVTLQKNLDMARNVAWALGRVKCAHVVYMSSDAVYDSRLPMINEDSCCHPSEFHGIMHLARERVLDQACQGAKIPFAILRPCAVYGAGDTHNSYGPNRFIRSAIKDHSITLFGKGEEIRDHVYGRDVAEAVRMCLLHHSAGILNVVSGQAASFYDVAQRVAAAAGSNVGIQTSPRFGPVTHRQFDITRLIKAFPAFRVTDLDKGIAQTWAAFSK
jgi:nucleoside-diphosphate-sugar epimerase